MKERDAIHSVVLSAWRLCDETANDNPPEVPQDRWDDLSKSLDALKALIPASEQPAQPAYAVKLFWPSPAPSPEPQDVREALRNARAFIEHATFNVPSKERLDAILLEIDRALKDPSPPPNARETADAIVLALCDSCNAYFDNFDRAVDVVAAALAQSDAQPVGWEIRAEVAEGFLEEVGEVLGMTDRETNQQMLDRIVVVHNALSSTTDLLHRILRSEGKPVAEIEDRIKANGDLYTAPHSPDASGLIEAAEWLERRGNELGTPHERSYAAASSALRARAADRSAPRSDRGGA